MDRVWRLPIAWSGPGTGPGATGRRPPGTPACRSCAASFRKGGGLVDAPGRWLMSTTGRIPASGATSARTAGTSLTANVATPRTFKIYPHASTASWGVIFVHVRTQNRRDGEPPSPSPLPRAAARLRARFPAAPTRRWTISLATAAGGSVRCATSRRFGAVSPGIRRTFSRSRQVHRALIGPPRTWRWSRPCSACRPPPSACSAFWPSRLPLNAQLRLHEVPDRLEQQADHVCGHNRAGASCPRIPLKCRILLG